MRTNISGIILAGGKNTRMGGTNKAFLNLAQGRLIDRVFGVFQELFPEVIIVTNSPLDYVDLEATIVTDIFKDRGSLGGLYTGLFYISNEYGFVAPCDLPHVDGDFIRYMIDSIGKHQIVVPNPPDGLQPLHGIYSRKTLAPIERLLKAGNLKIIDLYRKVKPLIIPAEIIRRFDPEGRMFFNINAPEDLKRWEEIGRFGKGES